MPGSRQQDPLYRQSEFLLDHVLRETGSGRLMRGHTASGERVLVLCRFGIGYDVSALARFRFAHDLSRRTDVRRFCAHVTFCVGRRASVSSLMIRGAGWL